MGEYTMKNKILLILGISFALISMLAIELALMGGVLWLAGIRTSDKPTDLSGLPYLIGALAVIAFIFWISRGATPTGAPIDLSPHVIKLGTDRHSCDDIIMYYAAVADARQYGRQIGAEIILVPPDGFKPEAQLDFDAWQNWQWLEKHGPANGVTIKK